MGKAQPRAYHGAIDPSTIARRPRSNIQSGRLQQILNLLSSLLPMSKQLGTSTETAMAAELQWVPSRSTQPALNCHNAEPELESCLCSPKKLEANKIQIDILRGGE